MKQTGFTDEVAELAAIYLRDRERFEQAHDEYSLQVGRVPLRDDFSSDEDYEDALEAWSEITDELLARAKELEC